MPSAPMGLLEATPALLARRELLHRVDTKYLLGIRAIDDVIAELADHYAVLRHRGQSLMAYRSLYFDTPDLRLYDDHRRGRRLHRKIRIRHYPDRQVSFLELKVQESERLTRKHRLDLPYGQSTLGERERGFLASHAALPVEVLGPQVWVGYRRTTLLGLHTNERVTVDTDLQLVRGDRVVALDQVAIMEVKQAAFCRATHVMATLQRQHIRPRSFSKYCIALALTCDGLRRNRFKPTLRALGQVNG